MGFGPRHARRRGAVMNAATPGSEARRVQATELGAGSTARLSPGGTVELLNVSATGALVETRHRLATGTNVVMSIDGDRPQRLSGSIVRSTVTAIHRDSTMTYQLAIAFTADSKFEGIPQEPDPEPVVDASIAAAAPRVETAPPALVNEW
jgi:hypothetical protein